MINIIDKIFNPIHTKEKQETTIILVTNSLIIL